jgi:hypothetical protein
MLPGLDGLKFSIHWSVPPKRLRLQLVPSHAAMFFDHLKMEILLNFILRSLIASA